MTTEKTSPVAPVHAIVPRPYIDHWQQLRHELTDSLKQSQGFGHTHQARFIEGQRFIVDWILSTLKPEELANDDRMKVCTVCGRQGPVGRCCGRDTWRYKQDNEPEREDKRCLFCGGYGTVEDECGEETCWECGGSGYEDV